MLLPLFLMLHVGCSRLEAACDDSTYATPALRSLVGAAAVQNARLPADLLGYQADLESEIALVLRSGPEKESALQIEQVESRLHWRRPDDVEQRIVGYRARSVALDVSALTYFKRPWIAPVLYGNRLRLLLSRGEDTPAPASAIHPFARDRDAYYQFRGGDTVEVLHSHGRDIPIVRIQVEPQGAPPQRVLLFRGELDVDAQRFQVVRMRGEFVQSRPHRSIRSRLSRLAMQVVAYAELENGEFLGAYWLPTYQRIEAQGRSPLAAELRPVFRVVTRFRRHVIDERAGSVIVSTAGADSAANGADTEASAATAASARLTTASRDSVTHFADWHREIGDETVTARASDFDDVAADAWRSRGAERLDWHADRMSDVVRFNRVEGLFTGASASLRFRDRAPGLSVVATGGVAWSEETWRGGVAARRLRGPWAWDLRGERQLANTNDFRPTLDFESSLMAALVTADDYDYLDRRRAGVSITRALGGWSTASMRVESGFVQDRAVSPHVRFGLFHPDSGFRANRAIDPGSAWRNAFTLSVHPNVSGELLEPGIGASVSYERGDGSLRWQRVEARLIGRHTRGPVSYAARLDAAAAFGAPVPLQQLLEFGENEGLPGYRYKEFGGDRAALLRGNITYTLPFLQAPVRAWRGVVLPSLAPSIAVGVQSGWAAATNSTLQQLAMFGTRRDSLTGAILRDSRTGLPVLATRPTDGVRSTVGITLRFFGGALGIGVARAFDRREPWRLTFGVGQGL